MINNVGFEIDGQNILKTVLQNKKQQTFLRKA